MQEVNCHKNWNFTNKWSDARNKILQKMECQETKMSKLKCHKKSSIAYKFVEEHCVAVGDTTDFHIKMVKTVTTDNYCLSLNYVSLTFKLRQ